MKVILKALAENRTQATTGWWGVEIKGYRYLMRYLHPILVWDINTKVVVHNEQCTKTDRAGVAFAIKHLGLIDNTIDSGVKKCNT
jgi:hypothetical protein